MPIRSIPPIEQQYFKHLEFQPCTIPCLDVQEAIAEKIRAAYQRARVRDLFDLYLFSKKPFERDLVRALAVLKLWQVRDPFDPEMFIERLHEGKYDWRDRSRLVASDFRVQENAILQQSIKGFSFLRNLSTEESKVAKDSKAHRQKVARDSLARWCLRQLPSHE